MRAKIGKSISLLATLAMVSGLLAPASVVEAEDIPESQSQLIGDIAIEKFKGDDGASEINNFLKISHPRKPASKMEFDPKKDAQSRENHQDEVFIDGVVDYMGNAEVGEPSLAEGAETPGDRGESYSWAGFAYGDWMYVSTLFNSTEQTGRLLGEPIQPDQLDKSYGGDLFVNEPDDPMPNGMPSLVSGSTLTKVNVKTGETKIIMSKAKNGIEPSFRNAVEYHDKLYFCGSINHLPGIYEVDPKTDAFQCVYQDPSIRNHPGGPGAAYQESLAKEICPTIRGLTVFQDYLVISTVGIDGNPYIAVSQDPTAGFTTIAKTWEDVDSQIPGELLGYPACKIPDSIMGGSIWEMVEFNGSLYVAIATGTPANAPEKHTIKDDDGTEHEIIDTMQSFALIRGDYDPGTEEAPNKVSDADAWTWTPVIGDTEKDGAKYTFGIDPERTRSSACNLIVYDDHLYIGEYNDTQIAFKNMVNSEFDYLIGNLDQSVSLYRMDKDENIEKVMGDPTEMFPTSLSGIDESGFGRRESQYIWQSKVFDGKLYLGTFDETMILNPLAQAAADMMNQNNKSLDEELDSLDKTIDETIAADGKEPAEDAKGSTDDVEASTDNTEASTDKNEKDTPAVLSLDKKEADTKADSEVELAKKLAEVRSTYETKKETGAYGLSVDTEGEDPFVILPSSFYDQEPLVTVDSPESLYLALLTINDLLEGECGTSTKGQLYGFIQYQMLYDQILAYKENPENAVPQMMSDSAALFEEETPQREEIKDLGGVIKYLESCIAGFDMYVSEDGIHFDKITQKGLNDPYNQGLRVFAANDDPENPWMCIGTANPFYGTQLWRMDGGGIDYNEHDEKQVRVQIKFVDRFGEEIPRQADKAGEIYVVESQTTIVPEDIAIMVPGNQQLKNPTTPVDVVYDEETGTYSATIEVNSKYKDVQVKFEDADKPASGNLVSTAPVTVQSSRTSIPKSKIDEVMPSGYVLSDESADINIIENTEGESVSYSAKVPVKRAYPITVVNGKASAVKAPVGTEVTIKANVPLGYTFGSWTTEDEIEIADVKARETTFIMPAHAVTITAEYADAAATYPVTVKNGEGSGRYKEGEEVTITAEIPEGKTFTGWTSKNEVEFADAKALTTTFIMPSYGVTVTAGYRDSLPFNEVIVEGGEGSGNYEQGTTVQIKATVPEGKVFVNWTSEDGVKFADAGAEQTTFTMPETDSKVTVKANFKEAPEAGWNQENGKWYYYDENLKMLKGWHPIDGYWYYFHEDGHMAVDEEIDGYYIDKSGHYAKDRWVNNGNGWWYEYAKGGYAHDKFEEIDGYTYYFGSDGYIVTGWKHIDGNWYYFHSSGYVLTGWFTVGSTWYYSDSEGRMVTGMSPDGYLLSESGAMAKNAWVHTDDAWYYADANGRPFKGGWKVIGSDWYFFANDGKMLTGMSPDGYLLSGSGAMAKNAWVHTDDAWYYADANGRPLKGGWKVIGSDWYFFANDGKMLTGMSPDGYLLSGSGAMAKNAWVVIDDKWYYADAQGRPVKNTWKWIGSDCYYFHEDGTMAADEIVDGYYVDQSGHWVTEKAKVGTFRTAVYNLIH